MALSYRVEIEQEEDGRWLAEVVELPGVVAYGETADAALAHAQALALRVLADREDWPDFVWAFHDREEIGPPHAGADREAHRAPA